MATNGQAADATPTGCFKCGRPGHWSRDCPVKSANGAGAGRGNSVESGVAEKGAYGGGDRFGGKGLLRGKVFKDSAAEEAVVKVPRKRPQLTAELLLSDKGLGYLLEKMPQMVKIRGEGHELHDLKSLLECYVHWHSQLHPYLGFNDFVTKVEKLGATKRVRMCVKELREKVTSGVVPDVHQENTSNEAARPSTERTTTDAGEEREAEAEEWLGADFNDNEIDPNTESAMPVNEDVFEDFFRQGTTQPNETLSSGRSQPNPESTAVASPIRKLPTPLSEDGSWETPTSVTIDESLAARMVANRLKALERAKARRATLQIQ